MAANFTLFFIAIFLGGCWWGWQWPYIAKLMPVYVAAVPGLILALVQLYRDATGWERKRDNQNEGIEMDEIHDMQMDKQTEFRRTVVFFGWFIGGAVGIWLLGIVYALPLLVFLYVFVDGREKLISAVAMSAGIYAVVWGLFEFTLEMRWPSGLLFS